MLPSLPRLLLPLGDQGPAGGQVDRGCLARRSPNEPGEVMSPPAGLASQALQSQTAAVLMTRDNPTLHVASVEGTRGSCS